MNIEIPIDFASVVIPGYKVVSNEVINNTLITTLETDNTDYPTTGIFTFYYTNKTGYAATDGIVDISIKGDSDAIGTITPSFQTSVDNNVIAMFSAYIPITATKVLKEVKINITINYNVNGETQSVVYRVIIRPPS